MTLITVIVTPLILIKARYSLFNYHAYQRRATQKLLKSNGLKSEK